MEYYQKDRVNVLKELESDLDKGLSQSEASSRFSKYGKNMFTPPEKESIFNKIFDNLKEPLIIILMISGVISIAMGHIPDGIGIFVAVLIATTIAVVQEGRSDKSFEALSRQSENINVRVVRDGETIYILKSFITIGDIVHLEIGDKVPADGRLLHTLQLNIDESMLTGEAEAVNKNTQTIAKENIPLAERKNMVYSGTLVVEGRGIMIVTSIGDNTEVGKIAKELKKEEDLETPLQQKLTDLGKKISVVGSIAAGLIFLLEVFFMFRKGNISFEGVKNAFVVSVALIVAAVPEGLPTMVALTLAFNMTKMARNNALVRKMIACETIGSVNVICSDKTGTLTQNRMTVVDLWADGRNLKVDKNTSDEMIKNMCLNSTADVHKSGNDFEFIGNPTECALLVSVIKNGLYYNKIRNEVNDIVAEYHFTSSRKMMSTAVQHEKDGEYRLYTKGSPEKVLSICDRVLLDGKIVSLTKEIVSEIESQIKELQEQAKRIIGFAYNDFPTELNWEREIEVERNLIFIGFVGIQDPLREDVKEAIDHCRGAGISVKMLTGDNINTARAIATQLGIIEKDSLVLEITEIEKMTDEELTKILDRLVVLARSTPATKMRIVKLLKDKNNSVVVTGDGINDAPALKSADVGIAMGIAGTEVSKEASDIVLLDDSFSTIVKAVKWGRGIYENFQRFIQFQLTVNVVAFVTAFFAEIFGLGLPFTTLQLLWVNIIMDGPPALSLGLEPPREHLLMKKPIVRNASIVTKEMLFKIISNGLFIVLALLFLMKTNILGGTSEQHTTIVFTTFVMFQLWNAFNCREFGTTSIFRHIHKNRAMIGIILITFFIQILVTQFGGSVFKTTWLELNLWIKIIAYSFSVIVFNEIIKACMFVYRSVLLKNNNSRNST